MADIFSIGIDLGGTNVKGVVIDKAGNILEKIEQQTEDKKGNSGELWKTTIYEIVAELKGISKQEISAIGLAAPGIADRNNECIVCMPGRLKGLENFRWENFLDVGKIPVRVINDAHAALMGESRFGVGKGYKNIVMLTLGTGVGGGILIDGKLYQGHFKRAGHVGHISLNHDGHIGIANIPGSLEEAIGNASIRRRTDGRFESTDELIEAGKNGDYHASFIWLQSVRNLSIGICSLINSFAPEIVILGGGITRAGESLFKPLEQFMNLYEWRPGGVMTPVKEASFQKYAGAAGAAAYASASANKMNIH